MRRRTKSSSAKTNFQAQMSMGGGFAGESSRRYTSPSFSVQSKSKANNYQPTRVGLYCRETWQLPSSKEHSESSKVRNKRRKLCKSPNRRAYLDQVTSDEERSILRACSQIDEGRKKFRRIGRSSSRYDSTELSKATKVRTVSDLEKEEDSFKRTTKMESLGHWESRPGFSGTGDLDEQQHAWIPKTFQTEAALGVGNFQSWEDFNDNEVDDFLSDLYDSDGCSSSG